ncbi:transposase [Chryseobacterium sp. MA9]|uniref:transposase n=1 Tax=Chryseobacterium sp. MA9 TaxID=2966625 RepID=UPI00210246BE|nr:transposase [Chryseobacterium sp. MA9]UTX49030.1 transposase [Chryseobacterium sp. MA9]
MNFKTIHIGQMIEQKIAENGIEVSRICSFLNVTEVGLQQIYKAASIDSDLLLRISKLTDYDFFRIYSQHLILYSPSKGAQVQKNRTGMPVFKKGIYSKEVIEFILELITSGRKTKSQIIEEYRIPKTTLYKWMKKFQK